MPIVFRTRLSIFCLICLQRHVFKQPITDLGKKSKKGRLTLQRKDNTFETIQEGQGDPAKVNDIKMPFSMER